MACLHCCRDYYSIFCSQGYAFRICLLSILVNIMKKLLFKSFIYIALLLIIIAGINAYYIHFCTEKLIMNVPDNIQICNFGSSHGRHGFNYEDFKEKYTCSNFALTSQHLIYDYRILQHYQGKIMPGAKIFILASYFSFFGVPEREKKDFLSKNKRYYRLLPPSLILDYDWKTDIFVNYLPSMSLDGFSDTIKSLFRYKRKEKISYENFNAPHEGFGKTIDSHDVIDNAAGAYERHIVPGLDANGRRFRRQEAFDAIYSMIELCRKIKAVPILVTVPYTKEYTDCIKSHDPKFFDDFYEVINEITSKTGIKYYDYGFDERFWGKYDLFIDSDHLNYEGARIFTDILFSEALGINIDTP